MNSQDQSSRESALLPLEEDAEPALAQSVPPEVLAFVVQNANEGVYILDEQRNIVFVNDTACRLSGYARAELLGMHVHDLDPGATLAAPAAVRKRAFDGERTVFETMHRHKSGQMIPVEVSLVSGLFEGRVLHSSFVRDITRRKALREGEQRFRVIADTSPVALLLCEEQGGRIQYANTQASRLLHLTIPSLLNHSFLELLQAGGVNAEILAKLDAGEEMQNREFMLRYGEGAVWVALSTSNFELDGARVQCNALMDVTEAHELSNQLTYQATYDDLTGLVNRREFEDRLQEVIELAQERRSDNVLCYLDLDQFKVINDTCGHMAGDELLRQLAQELYRCVRRDDTLARLGGDEFAILLENCSLENAERAANNVRHAVQNFRFMWNDNMFTIGVSIGLTLISQDGESLSEVLRRADAACYAAKEAGRNRVHVF
ncbi:MAG: diguanylate cyclase, partial [Pseudomonadota bacterium]|nr:diguanylate cyclase [Pseudomonadota bacterium]